MHLGRDRVALHAFAQDLETFREMTKDAAVRWHLLLVDAELAAAIEAPALLRSFAAQNPGALVCLEQGEDKQQFELPHGAITHAKVLTEDEWLAMMHSLLDRAAART